MPEGKLSAEDIEKIRKYMGSSAGKTPEQLRDALRNARQRVEWERVAEQVRAAEHQQTYSTPYGESMSGPEFEARMYGAFRAQRSHLDDAARYMRFEREYAVDYRMPPGISPEDLLRHRESVERFHKLKEPPKERTPLEQLEEERDALRRTVSNLEDRAQRDNRQLSAQHDDLRRLRAEVTERIKQVRALQADLAMARARPPWAESAAQQRPPDSLVAERITALITKFHPDKHGSSQMASDFATELNVLRDFARGKR